MYINFYLRFKACPTRSRSAIRCASNSSTVIVSSALLSTLGITRAYIPCPCTSAPLSINDGRLGRPLSDSMKLNAASPQYTSVLCMTVGVPTTHFGSTGTSSM